MTSNDLSSPRPTVPFCTCPQHLLNHTPRLYHAHARTHAHTRAHTNTPPPPHHHHTQRCIDTRHDSRTHTPPPPHRHTHIQKGASTLVTFTVGPKALLLHDRHGNGVLFAGQYDLEFTNGVDESVVTPLRVVLDGGARVMVLDPFRPQRD